jgi:hypothetical protein
LAFEAGKKPVVAIVAVLALAPWLVHQELAFILFALVLPMARTGSFGCQNPSGSNADCTCLGSLCSGAKNTIYIVCCFAAYVAKTNPFG